MKENKKFEKLKVNDNKKKSDLPNEKEGSERIKRLIEQMKENGDWDAFVESMNNLKKMGD